MIIVDIWKCRSQSRLYSMDLSKFTEKSQAALTEAQNIATRNQHQAVDVEHLMLALLEQEDGLVPRLFEKAKVAPDLLKAKVEEELNRIPRVSGDTTTGQGVYVTQRLNKLLVKAQDEAKKLKDEYVSVEHLVLAMFDEPATTGIGKIFKTLNVRRDEFLKALTEVRGNQRVTSANPEATYEALEKYGRDLTKLAAAEQARPGHRPRCRNPPLHPGPVAPHQEQSRAHWRAGRGQDGHRRGAGPPHRRRRRARQPQGETPHRARPRRAHRGREVPRRIRGAPQSRAPGNHQGARARSFSSSTKSIPWSARAKPRARWTPATCSSRCSLAANCIASARPRSTNIASTSRKTPRSNAASSPCMVNEPSVEDTISILRGLRERYELHHGVRIQDAALVAAAQLSHRYISDRFLPDKAIDLMDEAAAKLRTEMESMPEELEGLERRLMQLEIEREALRKEKDQASKERLAALRKGNGRTQKPARRAQGAVGQRKDASSATSRNCAKPSNWPATKWNRPSARAISAAWPSFNTARFPARKAAQRTRSQSRPGKDGPAASSRKKSRADEVAEVVSRWTGIPVSRLLEGEKEKLLRLDQILHERVIGQDEAVQAVADAVIRARSGLKDPQAARSARSFSLARPAWAKPSWPARWPNRSSTARTTWFAST